MSSDKPNYIAMWSGPRNISTAMMRSWGARPDTHVTDEPFYGHFLDHTGIPHPSADEVIASMSTDWQAIATEIAGPIPDGKLLWYQKHITTHMLPHIDIGWAREFKHCFLIRNPVDVVRSYTKERPDGTAADLGYEPQCRIFEQISTWNGKPPPVLDSAIFLAKPEQQLKQLCELLDIRFYPAMLSWEPGIRATDGLWHKHWYAGVARSTGFNPPTDKAGQPALTEQQQRIVEECLPYYERMSRHIMQ